MRRVRWPSLGLLAVAILVPAGGSQGGGNPLTTPRRLDRQPRSDRPESARLFRDGLESAESDGASIWTFGDAALNAPNSQGVEWDDTPLRARPTWTAPAA